jgi:DNA recombination protein RmuC
MFMELLVLAIGAVIGAVVVHFWWNGRHGVRLAEGLAGQKETVGRLEQEVAQARKQLERLAAAEERERAAREQAAAARASQAALQTQLDSEQARFEREQEKLRTEQERRQQGWENERQRLQNEAAERFRAVGELQVELDAEREKVVQRLGDLAAQREQFHAVATKVVEERTEAFRTANQTSVAEVLKPLREQMLTFEQRLVASHADSTKERTVLGEQVRSLMDLNNTLSTEAHNLTTALRGESKTRGAWGEVLLERILQSGGLQRDVHYRVQASARSEDGPRVQPDVVIELPDDRRLVVDSKVSLVAFQEHSEAETDAERADAVRRHVAATRQHVNDLEKRDYATVHAVSSFDFVVMFVPIEPAFLLAIQSDPGLWEYGWQRKVLMVSPSTLLFVVRTVAHLWRTEDQQKNARSIAEQAGKIFDKLASSLDDLDKVGRSLTTARETFDTAHRRLFTGRANVSQLAQRLKESGAATNRDLPDSVRKELGFADDAHDDE